MPWAVILMRQPVNVLYVMCGTEGQTRQAEVVGDVISHYSDQRLLWDPSNWQGLCKPHHSPDKQAEERGFRKRRRIGADGYQIEWMRACDMNFTWHQFEWRTCTWR